jgi:hypothetical protein
MEKLTRGRPRAPAGYEKRVHPTQHTSLQPWGCDSHIWTCNRRQTTLPQLRENAVNCVLCSMLIHGLENRPTYKRLSQEMDLDVTPVWLLLPGPERTYNQELELYLEQQDPIEVTAVEFRSRFGM